MSSNDKNNSPRGGKNGSSKPGKSGQRGQGRVPKPEQPGPSVPLLRYGGDRPNLHTWRKKMTVSARQKYGDIALIFDLDEYPKIPDKIQELTVQWAESMTLDDPIGDQETKSSEPPSRPGTRSTTQSSSVPSDETPATTAQFSPLDYAKKEVFRMMLSDAIKTKSHQEEKLRQNKIPLCAYMEESMSRESIDAVYTDVEYAPVKDNGDPLLLWLAIKRTHMVASTSGVATFRKADAVMAFVTAKQNPYETIVEFKVRFDHLLDALIVAGNDKPSDQDIAVTFLQALNSQFNELKNSVQNDELKGYNRLPKTLSDMYALASSYKIAKKASVTHHGTAFVTNGKAGGQNSKQSGKSNGKSSGGKDSNGNAQNEDKPKRTMKCYNCGEEGHKWRDCTSPNKNEASGSAHCTMGVTVKANRGDSFTSPAGNGLSDPPPSFEWYEVLLDNQSNVNIVHPWLLSDIRDAKHPMRVDGLETGRSYYDRVGDLEGFFECYAGKESTRANVLSQTRVEDIYPISYEPGNCYTVYLPDRELKFYRTRGMYVGDMRDWCTKADSNNSFKATVAENMKNYTKNELKRAKLAKEFVEKAGYPSERFAIEMVSSGSIAKLPFSSADVRRCFEIYGPFPAFVRGRKTSKSVKRTEVDPHLKTGCDSVQTMYSDILTLKGQNFLYSLAEPLGLNLTTPVRVVTSEALGYALQEQISTLRSTGFAPRVAYLDPQAAFTALVGKFPGVQIDVSGAGDHVERAEAGIRRMKEIGRSVLSDLPFVGLPDILVAPFAKFVVSRRNVMPSVSNSARECPRVLFTGRRVDFAKEFQLGFLDYCEVYVSGVKSNDVTKARTVPCLSLYPTGNANGSWVFFNLKTKRHIRSSNYTKMVMSELVLDAVNAMYASNEDHLVPVIEPDDDEAFSDYDESSDHDDDSEDPDDHDEDGMNNVGDVDTVSNENVANQYNVDMQSHDDVIEEEDAVANYSDMMPSLTDDEDGGETTATVCHARAARRARRVVAPPVVSRADPPARPVIKANEEGIVDNMSDANIYQPPPEIDEREDRSSVSTKSSAVEQPTVEKSEKRAGKDVAQQHMCYHTSVREGLEEHGHHAYHAIVQELKQLIHDKKVMHPVHWHDLSPEAKASKIRSFLFLKTKYDGLGRFEKIKARLVANGAQQDRKMYGNVSSPTAKSDSVLMVLAIAAYERHLVTAVDIGGAYLNAKMSGEEMIMELDAMLTSLLLKVAPEVAPFIDKKGKVLVRLDKALYGCVQSARLWYETLVKKLKSLGFTPNKFDPCVLNMKRAGAVITVVVYVDDILITCPSAEVIAWLKSQLKTEYGEVKEHEMNNFSYLGMHIFASNGAVRISMESYVNGLLEEFPVTGSVTSPATAKLFEIDPSSPLLDENDGESFHRLTARCLYLAVKNRIDIMLTCNFLSTRVNAPTVEDRQKSTRLLKYLNGTRSKCLTLKPGPNVNVVAHVDASFALHEDAKSHTGCVITVGGATVNWKSSKQKIVTRDSTEAELVGVSDMMLEVLRCQEFMLEQGMHVCMPMIMQDNMSTIELIVNNRGRFRTRHLRVRQAHVHEAIMDEVLGVGHLTTKMMLGDPLSKPLQGMLFQFLTDGMFGEPRELTMTQGRVETAK